MALPALETLAAEASRREPRNKKPVNWDQDRRHDSAAAEQKPKESHAPESRKSRALCGIFASPLSY